MPLSNKAILKVDAVLCLKDTLGEPCLYYRDTVYDIIAGNTPDYSKAIFKLYSKFPKFREYVNEEYYYGDDSKPLADRILEQMQESIAEFVRSVQNMCDMTGGKYLTYTHHYLYYAYATPALVPEIAGGITIC